ncbi:MAG: DUF2845 domain-containing protein [Myxococcota bacterium]
MRRLPLLAAFGLAGLVLFGHVGEAQALRCGNRLVQRGQSRYEVRQLCGEPQDIVRSTGYRQVAVQVAPGFVDSVAQAVQIERWTYDFGSNRFMRHLTFEAGTLVHIDTGRRGVRPAIRRPRGGKASERAVPPKRRDVARPRRS